MPNLTPFFVTKFLFIFLAICQYSNCFANQERLNLADSLFASRQYKEALTHYESLLNEGQMYSPAMLLKMAFITEGMGNFPQATYYLSKYYSYNPNPKVIEKIKSLTNQSNLIGYTLSDQDQFLRVLFDYQQEITSVFAVMMLGFLIMVFVLPSKRNGFLLPASFFLVLTFASNNLLQQPDLAIVTGSPTLIMDKPTAAGSMIRKVDAGHRVVIKSSHDIWYEIKWGERTAYIKKSNLSKI
jgi:hypothetical protein